MQSGDAFGQVLISPPVGDGVLPYFAGAKYIIYEIRLFFPNLGFSFPVSNNLAVE
jgi:hypothetical protein